MTNMSDLERMLHPKSIAVVGASRRKSNTVDWTDMFGQIVEFGYSGQLPPIPARLQVANISGTPFSSKAEQYVLFRWRIWLMLRSLYRI